MYNLTPLEKQLEKLDKRLHKAIKDCVPIVEEIRKISQNYGKDCPVTEKEINEIYKERLIIFDCLNEGKDLPEVISDQCMIQCVLLLEMMLVNKANDIMKKFPSSKNKNANKNNLLARATPHIEELENLSNIIKDFCEMFQDTYPEEYNKYK